MSLKDYQKKRNFSKTPEPKGTKKKRKTKLIFVVQKHGASHLHYDFRLELEGTLKSWAIPKGPCLDPTVKRLAVEVEDHPIDYAKFEGVIPKGQYGAGAVMIWDKGTWLPENDPNEGNEKGDLSFELKGEKLKGRWKLIRLKSKTNEQQKNWLLIKINDEIARNLKTYDITKKEPNSVVSGLLLEEIGDRMHKKKD